MTVSSSSRDKDPTAKFRASGVWITRFFALSTTGLLAFSMVELQHQKQALSVCRERALQRAAHPSLELKASSENHFSGQFATISAQLLRERALEGAPANAEGPADCNTHCNLGKPAARANSEPEREGSLDDGDHDTDNLVPQTEDQVRFSLSRVNAPIFRELGLSKSEMEGALRALSGVHLAFEGIDPKDMDPARIARVREQAHAELIQAIGRDKASQFEALQQTLPARSQLRELRNHLEDMGVAIDERQRAALLEAMSQDAPKGIAPGGPLAAPSEALMQRLKTILTPEQFRHFEEFNRWTSGADGQ